MPLAIQQALNFGREQLTLPQSSQSGTQLSDTPLSDTPELDTELILLFCLNKSRNILFTDPQQELSCEQELQFKALMQRRMNGEPVAYLIGTQGFWDLDLKVSPHTLIPRADTESLIDWLLESELKPKHILDLGTGTGALALALAREFSRANVTGVDVIEDAVQLALENKKLNNVENVQFFKSDWFAALKENTFDLIVSNPPYIDEDDIHLSQGDVRFEPSSALVASNNGYSDLFHIADVAREYLTPGGCLIMEHGWQQAQGVRQRLLELGYESVGSGKDLAGHERFTFGYLKS